MEIWKIFLTSFVMMLLISCGSMTSDTSALTKKTTEIDDLKRRLAELEDMKPSLKRLVFIESDIKSLIGELDMLAEDSAGAPKTQMAEEESEEEFMTVAELMAAKDNPEPVKPEPVKNASQETTLQDLDIVRGNFAIHLESYQHEEFIKIGWEKLKHRFSGSLANLSMKVRNVKRLDGVPFMRIILGPLENEAKASIICEDIKSHNVFCAVDRYEGVPINEIVKF